MADPARNQHRVAGAIALLFCTGGLFLAGWGLVKFAETRQFVAAAFHTEGEVVQVDGRDDSDSPAMVRFETADGGIVRFQVGANGGIFRLSPGKPVEVLYLPNDPRQAQVNSFAELWLAASVLLSSGLAVIAVTLGLLWRMSRRRQ